MDRCPEFACSNRLQAWCTSEGSLVNLVSIGEECGKIPPSDSVCFDVITTDDHLEALLPEISSNQGDTKAAAAPPLVLRCSYCILMSAFT